MKTNRIYTISSLITLSVIATVLVISGLLFSFPSPVKGQDTSQAQQLCISTNGTWEYNGSSPSCVCPAETIWSNENGCRTDSQLCGDTGGEWGYFGGSTQVCSCPTGYSIVAGRCQPPERTPGGPLSDATCTDAVLTSDNCGIVRIVVFAINFLSALAGIVIIGSIMLSGFQYMTSQDDPGKVQKAKSRIITTFTALLLLIFMTAILNYLIPGGIF